MRGLDNFIEGTHDPNAPFNQVDWVEAASPILDCAPWVTDTMLGNPQTYDELGAMFGILIASHQPAGYTTEDGRHKCMVENAQKIADAAQVLWHRGQRVCAACNGDGFTAEHDNTPHEFGCDGSCPIQVQCHVCSATGFSLPTKHG